MNPMTIGKVNLTFGQFEEQELFYQIEYRLEKNNIEKCRSLMSEIKGKYLFNT